VVVNRFFSPTIRNLKKERDAMPEWMFLTKHALVLSLIAKNPRITAQELARAIGSTERQVRRVIADLFANEYINKKRVGRGIRYRINPKLSLRHHTHREIAVGDLLETLGWRRRQRKGTTPQPGGKGTQAEE
jgi:DNA-binding MarR family transcriptional regulator